jgi:hypothetical protein
MTNPHVIAPVIGGTPEQLSQRRALPSDLLREASGRLGVMALLSAALWVVSPAADHLAARAMGDPGWLRLGAADAICGVTALASVALFFGTRRSKRSPQFMLDLGLGYLVLSGLALGLVFHWGPVPTGWQMSPVISWNGAITLIFAGSRRHSAEDWLQGFLPFPW